MRYSFFAAPPHKCPLAAIGWEALLVVVLIQFEVVREAFGILLPNLADLTMIFVFSGVVFMSMEGIKMILPRKMAAQAVSAKR